MIPLSPSQRFRSDKSSAEEHARIMASALFERASDAAMLQTQLNLPRSVSPDPAVSAANYHRMEGAMLFLGILMTIGDSIQTQSAPPDTGLNFGATKVKP